MDRTTDDATLQDKEAHLRALFLKGSDGDAVAYRRFLSELGAHLRGFLRRRLHSQPGDVEDLVEPVSGLSAERLGERLLRAHAERARLGPTLESAAGRERRLAGELGEPTAHRPLVEALSCSVAPPSAAHHARREKTTRR